MKVYVIMIFPEASEPSLYKKAYKTMAEAQNAIQEHFGAPEAKTDFVFKGKDYTYYFIEEVQVAN